ncbi:hypothetical protein ACROYT_G014892 [Oculina patagonica]
MLDDISVTVVGGQKSGRLSRSAQQSSLNSASRSHIVASNLACCKFLTVLGHVSFPKSLRERRLCLFVESDKLKDLGNKASPAVINVKSSCIHKLENEDDDDYGRHVLVIFEFEILTNQTSVAVSLQPYDDYEEENAIEEMPWLDITLVDCNCSRFPNTTNIAVQNGIDPHASYDSNESNSSEGEPSESEDDQTGDATDSIEDNEEITHYTEYFKVKGSTYHEHFQNALRKSKRLLLDKEDVPVQLIIEPTNVADENAIIVQAELEHKWHPVGYIPGVKVKKTMDALDKNEIATIKFKSIEWKYIYALGEFRYVSAIVVTKVNKWLASDKDYQYNDNL